MKYSEAYFDNYYDGKYEDTFCFGFPLRRILATEWANHYSEPPTSFADIGCGCGQTLLLAKHLLPNALIYGVECQEIPKTRVVSKDIIFGDFMDVYSQLPPVDLLYVSCSMYIPWEKQKEFLLFTTQLAKKAVVFSNLYLTDGLAIPHDSLRCIIYTSKDAFDDILRSLHFIPCGSKNVDFYIPA